MLWAPELTVRPSASLNLANYGSQPSALAKGNTTALVAIDPLANS